MPDPIIRFGKTHKGKRVSECPTEYLDWLLGEDWLFEDLREAIESDLEGRADWHRMGED